MLFLSLLIGVEMAFDLISASCSHIKIPLEKIRADFSSTAPNIVGKQRFFHGKQSNDLTRQKIHYLPLINFLNLQYSGRIYLGTPPREFRVLLDTGSADLWVFSSKCSHSNRSCREHKRYDSSLSSTYRENGEEVSLAYLKGSVEGFISVDVLRVAGIVVAEQGFIEVTREPNDTYSSAEFDGIFGLGFQALSRSMVNTPLHNMAEQGLIKPVFSVLLNRNDGETNGGELILGGWDSSKFRAETLNTVPVTKPVYWQVAMDGVQVGELGSIYCWNNCEAVLDTGSSLILGPADQVEQIYLLLSDQVLEQDGLALVDCSVAGSLPDIIFYINGQKYKLSPNDFILKDDEVCALGLGRLSGNLSRLWVLGDIFLRRYYSIYDLEHKTVSLAHLK